MWKRQNDLFVLLFLFIYLSTKRKVFLNGPLSDNHAVKDHWPKHLYNCTARGLLSNASLFMCGQGTLRLTWIWGIWWKGNGLLGLELEWWFRERVPTREDFICLTKILSLSDVNKSGLHGIIQILRMQG